MDNDVYLIEKIIKGDNKAFEEFWRKYHGLVVHSCNRYFYSVGKITMGMYADEDVLNEVWFKIYKSMFKFDSSKGKVDSWVGKVAEYSAYSIARLYRSSSRQRKEDVNVVYLDEIVQTKESSITMGSTIPDINISTEMSTVDKIDICLYISAVVAAMVNLKQRDRIIFLHILKGVTQVNSALALGLSQSTLSKHRSKIYYKIKKEVRTYHDLNSCKRLVYILQQNKSNEEIATMLDYDIIIVEICKELLNIADMYEYKQEA